MPIEMQLNQIDRHKEITVPYSQDSGPYILKIYYRKANKIWEIIESRKESSNIRYKTHLSLEVNEVKKLS